MKATTTKFKSIATKISYALFVTEKEKERAKTLPLFLYFTTCLHRNSSNNRIKKLNLLSLPIPYY